jgi:hypothetical protein
MSDFKEKVSEKIHDASEKVHDATGKFGGMLDQAEAGNIPGTKGKHPVSAVIGTALTGGMGNAGTKGYLAVSSATCSIT